MARNKSGDNGRMYSKDPGRAEANPTKTFAKKVLADRLKDPIDCLRTLSYLVSIGVPRGNPVFQVVRDRIAWYIDKEKGNRLKVLDDEAYVPDFDGKVKRGAMNSSEYRETCVAVFRRHDRDMGRGKGEDFVGELGWGSGELW